MDGVAGARDDLSSAPSVDIANGAPTGAGATNEILRTWVDGRDGVNHEHVFTSYSTNGGATWSAPAAQETAGDRGYYSAIAISPSGTDAYLVYNAFTTPFRNDTTSPRALVGVVKHADIGASGAPGAFSELHRGAPGDPRGVEPEQPVARVPGRLRVCRGDQHLRRCGLERRPQRRRLPGDRRLARSRPSRRRRTGRQCQRSRRRSRLARRPSATPTSSAARTPTQRRSSSGRQEGRRERRPPSIRRVGLEPAPGGSRSERPNRFGNPCGRRHQWLLQQRDSRHPRCRRPGVCPPATSSLRRTRTGEYLNQGFYCNQAVSRVQRPRRRRPGIHTGHDPVRDPCVHQSGGSDRQGHTRLTRPAQDSRRAEAGGKYEQKPLAQRT